MIGYTMVGTGDLERASGFYDPLFAAMGLERCFQDEMMVAWGRKEDENFPQFIVCYPFDGGPASVGNGTMTAFRFDDAETVVRLHELALARGAQDEGKPGRRPQYSEGFFGAYVRDLDGNKLAFVCYDAGKGQGRTEES